MTETSASHCKNQYNHVIFSFTVSYKAHYQIHCDDTNYMTTYTLKDTIPSLYPGAFVSFSQNARIKFSALSTGIWNSKGALYNTINNKKIFQKCRGKTILNPCWARAPTVITFCHPQQWNHTYCSFILHPRQGKMSVK